MKHIPITASAVAHAAVIAALLTMPAPVPLPSPPLHDVNRALKGDMETLTPQQRIDRAFESLLLFGIWPPMQPKPKSTVQERVA